MDSSFRILSYPFRIRTDLSELSDALTRMLAPFTGPPVEAPIYVLTRESMPEPNGRILFSMEVDGQPRGRLETLGEVLDSVVWHINAQAIKQTENALVLHAGAVSTAGRAVLLPAPPGSGKTTLTAGLVRAGFSYLTDEAAVIDPIDTTVKPYPRPLAMDASSLRAIPGLKTNRDPDPPGEPAARYFLSPDELRPGSISGPCRVKYVIAPRYQRGSSTTLRPITKGEAIVVMARNSLNFSFFGARALAILRQLAEGCASYHLRFGNLDEAVNAVRRLTGGWPESPLVRRALPNGSMGMGRRDWSDE